MKYNFNIQNRLRYVLEHIILLVLRNRNHNGKSLSSKDLNRNDIYAPIPLSVSKI